jgi:serine/threonine protein kinase
MSDDDLLQIYAVLVKSNTPSDIFGLPLTLDNVSEKYKNLIRITHPDHYNGNKKLLFVAEEATKMLNQFYQDAKNTLSGSTSPINSSINTSTGYDSHFTVGDGEYNISNTFIDDNFCRVHFGERISPAGKMDVCLKISKNIDDNHLMINESQILSKCSHKSIPDLVERFISKDGYEVNVIKRVPASYDLVKIKEKYPNGIPQEHVVWMMDRLLSVIGYLHTNGIIHGGIEPSNILITPHNHNATLIDYAFAIDDANDPDARYSGVNDFSAPEIDSDIVPHPSADMYSFGKTMEYIIGGNKGVYPSTVDKRIIRFISGFLEKDPSERSNDAWTSWHELKSLRKEIFGSGNQFLPFDIKM